jgi:dUTP pyrophosphatase
MENLVKLEKNGMVNLKFKRLIKGVELPKKERGNVGIDLYCVINSAVSSGFVDGRNSLTIPAGERLTFSTGLAVDIPEGYAIILKDRSGLAVKQGIHVLAGVIDSSYTGELLVCLFNTSNKDYIVKDGDKICQMVVIQDFNVWITETEEMKETQRGDKGFGSSGR